MNACLENNHGILRVKELDAREYAIERIVLGMRRLQGVDLTGLDYSDVFPFFKHRH